MKTVASFNNKGRIRKTTVAVDLALFASEDPIADARNVVDALRQARCLSVASASL